MLPPATEPPALPLMAEEVIIAQGCTSACAYCFSRLARGHLTSVPIPDVVRRVREAMTGGSGRSASPVSTPRRGARTSRGRNGSPTSSERFRPSRADSASGSG